MGPARTNPSPSDASERPIADRSRPHRTRTGTFRLSWAAIHRDLRPRAQGVGTAALHPKDEPDTPDRTAAALWPTRRAPRTARRGRRAPWPAPAARGRTSGSCTVAPRSPTPRHRKTCTCCGSGASSCAARPGSACAAVGRWAYAAPIRVGWLNACGKLRPATGGRGRTPRREGPDHSGLAVDRVVMRERPGLDVGADRAVRSRWPNGGTNDGCRYASRPGRGRPGWHRLELDESEERAMRVREVMTSPVSTLQARTPLQPAAALLVAQGFTGAPVVDGDGPLVDVMTEGGCGDGTGMSEHVARRVQWPASGQRNTVHGASGPLPPNRGSRAQAGLPIRPGRSCGPASRAPPWTWREWATAAHPSDDRLGVLGLQQDDKCRAGAIDIAATVAPNNFLPASGTVVGPSGRV